MNDIAEKEIETLANSINELVELVYCIEGNLELGIKENPQTVPQPSPISKIMAIKDKIDSLNCKLRKIKGYTRELGNL